MRAIVKRYKKGMLIRNELIRNGRQFREARPPFYSLAEWRRKDKEIWAKITGG